MAGLPTDAIGRVDREIGGLIEDVERRHHARRLEKIGWTHALAGRGAGWATGVAEPREGNLVEVCVDGANALPAITAAVRSARRSVHIAGWALTPAFAMQREDGAVTLRDLLADAAERAEIRVLVWAGAPFRLFHPTRAEAASALAELTRGTRIHGALDARNRPMHCHHEKLVIVDDDTAFVGGIDLTDSGGDRYDGAPHPSNPTLGWHDAAARLAGPAVADVASHFAMRWRAITGESLAVGRTTQPAGASRVQVARTVPERTYGALPHGDFGILEAYVGALRRARHLIYLENQFLWSTEIVELLRGRLQRPPTDDFRLCLVLPRHPNNGNDDTRGQLGALIEADRHHRLLAGTVGPPGRSEPPVYVHAKIGVVDDEWLTIGSANLNEHSLFNDTEMNLVTDDAALARTVRERLWSEHLGSDCAGVAPLDVLEERWRPLLGANATGATALRPLPGISRRAGRLLGPVKGLFVDG